MGGQAYKRRTGRKRKNRRNSQRARRERQRFLCRAGLICLVVLTLVLLIRACAGKSKGYTEKTGADVDASKPDIDVQLLDVNGYSRPGIKSNKINGIVIHYTANPGSSAQNNRDYFEGLKDSHQTKASSHFVVGLDGEIIQCIPTWEIAYASNDRNSDTVSIECCHPDDTGKFTESTYRSMVQLTAWLCKKFELDENAVIRHYDVTGKICPKYFVEDEEAWNQFKADVKNALEKE